MTNPMTPTEQDKELREAILLEFKNVHRLAPADYTENCTNVVMQLITADRKRVGLEARLDELERLQAADMNLYKNVVIAHRIAELKAQQEEV
jgi:hypothetical protein